MPQTEADRTVAATLDALYAAYFVGDTEGMLATMADTVEVEFLGRTRMRGREAARQVFATSNASLQDLDFRIRRRIIDGGWAAVIWDETAIALGRPYRNHGVDVFRVDDGEITRLRVNNDVVARRLAFTTDEAGAAPLRGEA